MLVSILSLSLSLPLIPANANYSSVAAALSAGDISAATKLMSSNRSISPASQRNIALADALSSGNVARASQIINGPVPSPAGGPSVPTKSTVVADALTRGDMQTVAQVVFGQDAVVAEALVRGDVSTAVKAINQGKKIDQQVIRSQVPSGTTNLPSGTTNLPSGTTNLPSGTTNLPSGTTNLPSGTTRSYECNYLGGGLGCYPSNEIEFNDCVQESKKESRICRHPITKNFLFFRSLDQIKNDVIFYAPELYQRTSSLAITVFTFNQAIENDLTLLNSKDRDKFIKSPIWQYWNKITAEYQPNSSFEDPANLLKIRSDENFINMLSFNQRYAFEKASLVTREFRRLNQTVLNLIPKFQCEGSNSRVKVPLNSVGGCNKGYRKVSI